MADEDKKKSGSSAKREWGDAGLPIGSPNDPAIGEAPDQTSGPGGSGLRKSEKTDTGHENRDHGTGKD